MYKLIAIMLLCLSTGIRSASPLDSPARPGRPRDFVLPAKTEFKLKNGLRVTLVPFGNLPIVKVRIVVRVGNINEAKDEVWLADLTGDLMKEGTKSRSAEQIAKEIAAIGGKVRIFVGEDSTTVRGDVLTEFGPKLVEFMADIVQNPLFPESELPRLKRDLIRSLNIQKSQVGSLVHERLRAAMFGDHPYGRAFPTEKMLNGYGIKAIKSFYESNFGAHRTHVYIVGRFDEKEMKAAIGRNLRDWEVGRAPLINVPKPSFENAVHLIDRPGAIQSTICIGIPVADPSHDDHPAVAVTDGLLGGAMMSRITRNIREEKGYTYDTFSDISARYRNAYWVLTAAVATDVTGAALGEICGEIRRLRSEPPPEEELEDFRNLVSGLYLLRNASPASIASQLSFLDLHGLDGSYPTRYVRKVHAVTPVGVQEVAQTYWRDDRILMVVAGDREKIYDQLRPFGSIVVD